MSQCATCTRDLTDGHACNTCITKLTTDLWTLAWLAGELETTRTRQSRIAQTRGAGRSAGGYQPLGYNQRAAVLAYDLHNWLVATVRLIHNGNALWPTNTPVSMALWLAHEPRSLQRKPSIGRITDGVSLHIERILTIINPMPDDQTFGICGAPRTDSTPCPTHLYGDPHATWVRCPACLTQHETHARVQVLEGRVRELYFRAATLARLLPRLIERPVTAAHIRTWAATGKPIRTELDDDDYPTYHTGDTIAVAQATPTRERAKKEAS